MRARLPLLVACLCLALFADAALARSAEHVIPGQKLFAELGPNDDVTVIVDLVAGSPVSLKATAYRGTNTQLDLAIADPDGKASELGLAKKSNAKASVVSIRRYTPTRTGAYQIKVSSVNGTRGGFDLTTSGAVAAKLSGTAIVDAAGAVADVPFEARTGDRVRCAVKPAKRSKLKPLLRSFVDAGGAEQPIGAAKRESAAVVATLGTSRFVVTGDAGTTGAFAWSLKFVRAKAPRARRDAAELNAVGAITGTVVVDGQTTRPASTDFERSARRTRAPDVRPGELVVSLPAARSYAEVEAAADSAMPGTRCSVQAALSESGPYLVRVDHLAAWGAGARAKSATRALAKSASDSDAIEWCAPNGIVTACDEPTDPLYAQQFNLRQLNLPGAWSHVTGSTAVVVAIIDSGKVPHPDLDGQWLPGYDFVTDPTQSLDGDGWDSDPTDSALVLHGTHVAGLVGAKTNNGAGIAGVVWQTKLLPVRVLGKSGGTDFDVAAGLLWAVGLPVPGAPPNANPARVVNMSLGEHSDGPTMRNAVAQAVATHAVIVAAAGNEATSNPFYPAAYPGVIAVYALDINLKWTSYTNYGAWISVGAPGGDPPRGQPAILSTYFDTTTQQPVYASLAGTSMASPQVAGVAALLLAVSPSLTGDQVKDVLQKTATDLGPPGFDNNYGWGIVNADAAVRSLLSLPSDGLDVAPSSLSFDGSTNQAGVSVATQAGSSVVVSSIAATTDQLSGWLTVTANQMTTPAALTVTIDPTLPPGYYTGSVRITTPVGAVDVPVSVVRAPRAALSFATVSAVDLDGRVVAQAVATAATNWTYKLENVPLGRYHITTLIDQNGDGELDRVDEWDGLWPLHDQPEVLEVSPDSLDADAINLPIERYDARFGYAGVGAGHVSGALAVRAVDARTGVAIAGADVHLAGGAPLSVTDARGRALVVGAFNGGQTVTIVAPGYGPMTRSGQDGQYEGFALEPLAAAPTTTVVATVRGLASADKDVWLQVGDSSGHAVYDGATDPAFALTFTTTPDPTPVSATAFDSSGTATRSALYELAAPDPAFDVAVAALPSGGARARSVQPNAPSSNFAASGAALGSTTWLRSNEAKWVAVGDSPLVFGQSGQSSWAAPGPFEPALSLKFEVLAADSTGRSARHAFYGTTKDPAPAPETFAFEAPPALTAPPDGATGVSVAALMTWSAGGGAQLHKVVVEEVGTSWRWTIWVPGTATQFQIPALPKGGLKSATSYRWSVETFRFGATPLSPHSYSDGRIDLDPTSRVFSGWAAFSTQ